MPSTCAVIRLPVAARDIPLAEAIAGGGALAVIIATHGPSYRPCGASMLCRSDGAIFGTLSSGCIDHDIAQHAKTAMISNHSVQLRYGQGSPFLDLPLPCGGAIDVLILPMLDKSALSAAQSALSSRCPAVLPLGPVELHITPELQILTFGKGAETRALSRLAQAAGYHVKTLSPDPETLKGLPNARLLHSTHWPPDLQIDPQTAIALFFHDHEWEPDLLTTALCSKAFYIGAQGSRQADLRRREALELRGLPAADINRLARPFGLIPSLRDPQSLALSVLAQILERATQNTLACKDLS